MSSSSSFSGNIFVFLFTAVILAPVSAFIGVLGFREFERYKQERMAERAIILQHSSRSFGPSDGIDATSAETVIETCDLCGQENEVSVYNANPECAHCHNTGGLS